MRGTQSRVPGRGRWEFQQKQDAQDRGERGGRFQIKWGTGDQGRARSRKKNGDWVMQFSREWGGRFQNKAE